MTSKQFNNLFSSSVPKIHRPVGASLEEGQQVDHRDGALLIWEKTQKIGFFQPGKERLWDDPLVAFLYLKGAYKKD